MEVRSTGGWTVLAGLLMLACAATSWAQRVRIEVQGADCEPVTARYVALLDGRGGAVVLSGGEFPGSERVEVRADGALAQPVSGHPGLRLGGGLGGAVYELRTEQLGVGPTGCLAFDKDRFTWESDVLSYVRYLDGLLQEARGLDPQLRTLRTSNRQVRLEVSRPGRDRAVLEGVEGGMLGYGRVEDEVRFFFVPVLLGADGAKLLVRVLRNQGSGFGQRATEHLGSVLVATDPVVSATEPAFEIRRLTL